MLRDNTTFTPELLTSIGAGLLSGNTWNQQLANAGLGASTAIQQQKQLADASQVKSKTLQMLQAQNPELAKAVDAGIISPQDAYSMHLKQQQEAAKAAKPEYGFQVVNNQLIRTNKTAGDFSKLGDFSNENTDAPASVQEYLWSKKNEGFPGTLEEYQKNKISLKNQKGTEGNLKSDLETMKAYRGEDPIKTFQVTNAAFQKARSAAQLGTAAGDMSLIYAFMKMNDPTSVVREGEYANAANTGGIEDSVRNVYNRAKDGTMLTPEQRAAFIQAAQKQYEDAAKNVEDVNKRYTPFAQDYNVNTDRFMINPEKYEPLKIGQKVNATINGKPVTIEKID